jgi:hypothetical protein
MPHSFNVAPNPGGGAPGSKRIWAGEVLDFSGAEKEEEFLKVDSPGEEGPRPNHA